MRKITSAALAATSASALALFLAAPAHAANLTATVTNGGSVTATNSGNLVITDTSTGISVTCTASTGSGSIPNGTKSGASPLQVGTISAISFTNCNGGGFSFTVTPKALPWKVNVTGATSTGGVTPGSLSGISAHASAAGGLCQLDIAGTAAGTYTNGTGKLTATGSGLTVSNVTAGCLGIAHNGDSASLNGAYIVKNSSLTFPQINVTSP
ncbi:hypothetical protein BKA00_005137 [Actinomadura coerulea]|uniref:Secreted protein n=1 Tax=Actinomadura coerulea TaxID=46159 RepID=A0A7X0L151_9ACTN|nr:hypothetical protein [Actinomadura coerulea]MBB6398223.1 hypothetical protein [Actinomadura coerulea]GGQ11234.1 hypothetical protein GCM10010187_29460 [Actinomadura coerulea]